MAISFSLDWGPPVTGEQLAAEFIALGRQGDLLPPDRSVDDLKGDGVLLRGGTWCRAGAAEPREEPWPDPLEEAFGIRRDSWAVFREQGDQDRQHLRDEMAWLVAGLLVRLPGDAALHFQYEVLWLVRREGRLQVSDRDDIWPERRLAMLPQPFERVPLRFDDR